MDALWFCTGDSAWTIIAPDVTTVGRMVLYWSMACVYTHLEGAELLVVAQRDVGGLGHLQVVPETHDT